MNCDETHHNNLRKEEWETCPDCGVSVWRNDTERLDWLLANMNKKGFEDMHSGICDRIDIDAAMDQQNIRRESSAGGKVEPDEREIIAWRPAKGDE